MEENDVTPTSDGFGGQRASSCLLSGPVGEESTRRDVELELAFLGEADRALEVGWQFGECSSRLDTETAPRLLDQTRGRISGRYNCPWTYKGVRMHQQAYEPVDEEKEVTQEPSRTMYVPSARGR
jgi:hypothetical protein